MDRKFVETLDYYYKNEVTHKNYYKMPKIIFTDYYNDLALNAKVAYMLLLDRVGLSEKNNWVDDEGRVRIIYTQEELSKILGCSVRTLYKIFSSLENFYGEGDGLIKLVSQGKSKPYLIYVKNIATLTNTSKISNIKGTTTEDENVEKNTPGNTVNNTVVENFIESYVENSGDCEYGENSNDKSGGETQNIPVTTSKNFHSQPEKNSVHDAKKIPPSKNNTNNNNINNNDISQSFTQERGKKKNLKKTPKLNDGENDKIDYVEIVGKMYQNKELPCEYMLDYSKMEIAIKHLIDFDTMEFNFENNQFDPFDFSLYKLFINTLVTMLTCEKMVLKNREIYSSKVYYMLCNYIKFSDTDAIKQAFIKIVDDVAIFNYKKGSLVSEIRNPGHYMAVCILDALNNGDIKMQTEIYSLLNADRYDV